MGFCFGPILVTFSIISVMLAEHHTLVFLKEKMNYTRNTDKSGKHLNNYSLKFQSPLLINAGLTYN